MAGTEQSAVSRYAAGKRSGIMGIVCNILLFGAKLTVGLLSGSVSIIADAINNLTDVSSSAVTLIGFHLASKPADEDHPYGHARMEYLAGLVMAFLILLCGYELAKTSVNRILSPAAVLFSWWHVAVLVASMGVKFFMMLYNKQVGKKIGSASLLTAAEDSRNDVLATGAVLVSLFLGHFFSLPTDGYMGLLVALFILYSGFCAVKTTIDPLLGAAPEEALVREIAQKLKSYEHVLGIHDLMVHDYGPKQRFASVHVEMDKNLDPLFSHNIIDNMERDFRNDMDMEMLIHYDPVTTDDEELNAAKSIVEAILAEIDATLTFHDFRLVPGPLHTNIIFDLVVPFSKEKEIPRLKEAITEKIRTSCPDYYPVICVDSDAFNHLA